MKRLVALSLIIIMGCHQRLKKPVDGANALEPPSQETILQSVFSVQWFDENQSINLKLVLHESSAGRASIAGFKAGQRILTIWMVRSEVWVYFPKEKQVFQGNSDKPIVLMKGGPKLSARDWIQILKGKDKRVQKLGQQSFLWSMQHHHLRWNLTKKKRLSSVPPIVLQPTYPESTRQYPLSHLTEVDDEP